MFKNVFAAVFSPFLKSTVEQIDDVDDSPDGGSGSLINAGPASALLSVLEDGKPKVIPSKQIARQRAIVTLPHTFAHCSSAA